MPAFSLENLDALGSAWYEVLEHDIHRLKYDSQATSST
jgi:hypothetical protein